MGGVGNSQRSHAVEGRGKTHLFLGYIESLASIYECCDVNGPLDTRESLHKYMKTLRHALSRLLLVPHISRRPHPLLLH